MFALRFDVAPKLMPFILSESLYQNVSNCLCWSLSIQRNRHISTQVNVIYHQRFCVGRSTGMPNSNLWHFWVRNPSDHNTAPITHMQDGISRFKSGQRHFFGSIFRYPFKHLQYFIGVLTQLRCVVRRCWAAMRKLKAGV